MNTVVSLFIDNKEELANNKEVGFRNVDLDGANGSTGRSLHRSRKTLAE